MNTTPKYAIDPGVVEKQYAVGDRGAQKVFTDDIELEGFRNADLRFTPAQLLANIQRIQLEQNIPQSATLVESASCKLNLDVEMETGTGKTYCYIKTMFEMHDRYGWNKFIIVVPSVAIREGVQKSFEITAEHFLHAYGGGYVEFTNGERLTVGSTSGDTNEDTLRRLQIRESIKAHLEKERDLFAKGIKVLTLFFIDTVAKYRLYDKDGTELQGDYGRYFEEEYAKIREDFRVAFEEDAPYQAYLDGIETSKTHDGYFSIDKKKQMVDPTVKRTGGNEG